jgi:hypothetical protein
MPRRFARQAAPLATLGGVTLGAMLVSSSARSDDDPPREPGVSITWPWLATQLVPSPELVYGDATGRFGLRWQVTPLLFSWGIHRGLSPWRFFVAEPYVRQSGSMEVYLTPEYVTSGGSLGAGGVLRTGLRSYFPLVEHGEYLSVSIGASQFFYDGRSGMAFEAGIYALYGVVGLQVTASPSTSPLATIATLRLRYF